MQDGADRQDLRHLKKFREQAFRHANDWYGHECHGSFNPLFDDEILGTTMQMARWVAMSLMTLYTLLPDVISLNLGGLLHILMNQRTTMFVWTGL